MIKVSWHSSAETLNPHFVCARNLVLRLTRGAGKFPDWGEVDQMVRNKSAARPPHISTKTSTSASHSTPTRQTLWRTHLFLITKLPRDLKKKRQKFAYNHQKKTCF